MPRRPPLLFAETPRYGLEITELDDGKFELAIIDWELESGDDFTFDTVAGAQRSAVVCTGVTSIDWRAPPSASSDSSA